MRERRDSFLSVLPRRERPLLAGKGYHNRFSIDYSMFKTALLAWCPENSNRTYNTSPPSITLATNQTTNCVQNTTS